MSRAGARLSAWLSVPGVIASAVYLLGERLTPFLRLWSQTAVNGFVGTFYACVLLSLVLSPVAVFGAWQNREHVGLVTIGLVLMSLAPIVVLVTFLLFFPGDR